MLVCCVVLWRAVLCCAVVCCGVVWCGVVWCGARGVGVRCEMSSLRVAEVEQLYQVKRMIGGIVNKTTEDEREEREQEREKEKEKERERDRRERERGPPCVHSTRPRVCVQNVPVCTGNMPTCFFHVDMLPVHTGTF